MKHAAREVALIGCVLVVGSGAAWAQCRQSLALALDVSGSVDSREYRLQLDGLASALIDRDVQQAILALPQFPISIAVYEWSGPRYQRLLLGWSKITNRSALFAISSHLTGLKRRPAPPGTALGNAMQFGADLLANGPKCARRTLDISGDGKSNFGPHPRDVRAALPRGQIVVNALVIGSDVPVIGDTRQVEISELSAYFTAWVVSGPNAFVETAIGFEDYHTSMVRKLLRELDTLAVSSLAPEHPGHQSLFQ